MGSLSSKFVRADRRSFCNGNFESALQLLRTPDPHRRESGLNIDGRSIAAFGGMKEPSEKRSALREAKESRAELAKIRMGHLDHHEMTEVRGLESEASQLSAIYATIILNMRTRLDRERRVEQAPRKRRQRN